MKKKDLNFDLKQLRSFLEILHEKSFTRASRKLRIGQATISHHIQLLEDMLGVRLIDRTSKEFSVTDNGKIFASFCEKHFENIETLKNNLKKNRIGGTTRVVASTIPSTYLLPGVIAGINRDYPDHFYRVEITDSREVIEMIKDGAVDVGVSGKQLKHPSVSYERIYSDEIVLIGSPDLPDRLKVKDIAELPLVVRESGSGTRDACEKALNKHGIVPSMLRVVYESSTTESMKEAVTAGIGAAFISSLAVKKELRLKLLKIVEIEDITIKRDFFALYLNNKHLSIPAQKLIDALKDLKKESG